jgi:hypothetical protein
MKIPSVAAELFHVDRRTDMTKLLIAFRNFANAPTNYVCYSYCTFNSQEHYSQQRKSHIMSVKSSGQHDSGWDGSIMKGTVPGERQVLFQLRVGFHRREFPQNSCLAPYTLRYKRRQFCCNRCIFKGTLLGEQGNFSSVSRLLWGGCSWNLTPHTLHALATSAVT